MMQMAIPSHTLLGAASNGTVTQYGDTVLYTPNPNYNGNDICLRLPEILFL